MKFFVGLHQPRDAGCFKQSFISVNRLVHRRSSFPVDDWIMDSGAFSTLNLYGCYPHHASEYAYQVNRWSTNGNMLAAVSQDYMCEPMMLKKTGLTIPDHQRLTIERYIYLRGAILPHIHLMPVLQGYAPQDYVQHIRDYGNLLTPNMWVGVGSICKRNGDPTALIKVLHAIKTERPDLRLHGFGMKITALQSSARNYLYTADSMAWSFRARKQGRDPNDWKEARQFVEEIA